MRFRRLDAAARVLCLLGPLAAVFLFVTGRFVVPLLERVPLTAALLARVCVWHSVTYIPCPLCGGTRALALAARGRWGASLMMNPLATCLLAGALAAAVWLGLCAATGRDVGLTAAGRLLRARPTRYIALALLAALWLRQVHLALNVRPL